MTKRTKLSTGIVSLLAACCVAGCSDTPAPAPQAGQEQTAASSAAPPASPNASELTLTVGLIFGDGQTFPNPDAALIEKHVRAKDWKNVQERPYVQLARAGEKRASVLKVQGTLGTPNVDGPFRAVVILYNADGTFWGGAESGPLETVDAAIELLLLFRNDVEKLKTIARQWQGEFAQ